MRTNALWLVLVFPLTALAQGAAEVEKKEAAPAQSAKPEKPPLDVSKMAFGEDAIKRVMAYHNDQLQSCYEGTLADRAKVVEGTINTSFVITPEGAVKKARVVKKGTTLKDGKLHECVVATLTAMTFPKPGDNRDHPVESFPLKLKAQR